MINSGYDPTEMIDVMKILKTAAGPNRVPRVSKYASRSRKSDRKNKRGYPRIQSIKNLIVKSTQPGFLNTY